MAEFTMPSLGADMDDGTLLEWRVKPGDRVRKGDIVALVDTDKAAIEIEIFFDGVVERLIAEPGQKLPVGAVLARVVTDGASAEAGSERPATARSRKRVSPAARRRARELGVDLDRVTPTGPGRSITSADVDRLAPSAEAKPAPERGAPSSHGGRLRHAIAAAMARSNRDIPHYYLATTFSMSRAMAFLERHNAAVSLAERLLPAALLIKATALALRDEPDLNGSWDSDKLVRSDAIHVGMAVSMRGGGVVVPAIHHTDKKPLADVMSTLRDLVTRARKGKLKSSELSDGTVTITSLGERAPEAVYGVIFPPQVALIGFGSIVERPWVVDGRVVAEPLITVTLAADHRATDGHLGGRFLKRLEGYLQQPERLI